MQRSPRAVKNPRTPRDLVKLVPPLPAQLKVDDNGHPSGEFPFHDQGALGTQIVGMGEGGFEITWPKGLDLRSLLPKNNLSTGGVLQVAFESHLRFEFPVRLDPGYLPEVTESTSLEEPADPARHGRPMDGDTSQTLYLETTNKEAIHDLLTLVRKDQHIALCATADVEAKDRDRGLEHVFLAPCTLPEISWEELDITTSFLGRTFKAPLSITGMTGGLEKGAWINRNLAHAAQKMGIPMGVGSQRIALEHPEHAGIFNVKKDVPNVFLIGNLGIAQLVGVTIETACERAQRAVDMIQADALAIHANVLQEAIQVEGDRHFKGVYRCLEALVSRLKVPVILKEVGVGVDPETAERLMDLGIAAIDIGGKGGTSWSHIEGLRSRDLRVRQVGETFRDFGIPTGIALKLAADKKRALARKTSLIATGGIRDGLAVAKCLGLGAELCGIGLPLLKAALEGPEVVQETLESFVHGLKIAMLATGSPTIAHLRGRIRLGRLFRDQIEQWQTRHDGLVDYDQDRDLISDNGHYTAPPQKNLHPSDHRIS